MLIIIWLSRHFWSLGLGYMAFNVNSLESKIKEEGQEQGEKEGMMI